LDKLQSRLVDVEREVALSQKEEGSMEWAEKMATFLSRARIEVQKNKDALGEAIAEISSVMTRYAVDTRAAGESGKSPQEEFLALVSDFCSDWKKAREDNVRAARMMEKMRARTEAAKREAMQKEEKRKRLMAAGKNNLNDAAAQVENIMSDLRQSSSMGLARSLTKSIGKDK